MDGAGTTEPDERGESGEPVRTSGSARPGDSGGGASRRLLGVLAGSTLLQWLGGFAIAPILPLYLADHDVSVAGVGVVMSAFFLGALLSQYVAGRLAGLHGHRPVLLAGLATYAAGCAGLFVTEGVLASSALRVLQGAGAGAFEVATLTAVAVKVAPSARGRAFSAVYTGQLLGVTLGPVLGGFAGVEHMRELFLAGGAAAVLASIPVLWMLPSAGGSRGVAGTAALASTTGDRTGPVRASTEGLAAEGMITPAAGSGRPGRPGPGRPGVTWLLTPGVVGLLLCGASGGFAAGVYETCWSLLMRREGVSVELTGLTFTLFGLPYLLFAWPAGQLADRLDRRALIVVAALLRSVALVSYPMLHSLSIILVVGCLEAVVLAVINPAEQSLLAQEGAASGATGRAQGLFATVRTATTVLAALVSGAIFAVDHRLPFVLAGLLVVVVTLSLPVLWRDLVGSARPARAAEGS
ncbi:MFS transporter [Candidatus Frankia nodulisporulans]|uniref:MFS transporter n=1 Tax=Candidatus Frankia nodulisporulans TaxID=2060052 RepID=UPI0013D3FDAC|nr:MFS transporter [Candidatus Frankia nodulisporulans]